METKKLNVCCLYVLILEIVCAFLFWLNNWFWFNNSPFSGWEANFAVEYLIYAAISLVGGIASFIGFILGISNLAKAVKHRSTPNLTFVVTFLVSLLIFIGLFLFWYPVFCD